MYVMRLDRGDRVAMLLDLLGIRFVYRLFDAAVASVVELTRPWRTLRNSKAETDAEVYRLVALAEADQRIASLGFEPESQETAALEVMLARISVFSSRNCPLCHQVVGGPSANDHVHGQAGTRQTGKTRGAPPGSKP